NVGFRADDVPVVLVERVEHPGPQFMRLAGAEILDRSGSLEHHHGLEVILVMHLELAAGAQRGQMKRETHAVVGQQQACALPAVGLHVVVAGPDFLEFADDHVIFSLVQAATPRGGASSVRTARSRMSSPASSRLSSMTSGASTLMISSCAPLVSMMRPSAKQASVIAAAVSPEPTSIPRIMPRPRVERLCSRAMRSRRWLSKSLRRAMSPWKASVAQK